MPRVRVGQGQERQMSRVCAGGCPSNSARIRCDLVDTTPGMSWMSRRIAWLSCSWSGALTVRMMSMSPETACTFSTKGNVASFAAIDSHETSPMRTTTRAEMFSPIALRSIWAPNPVMTPRCCSCCSRLCAAVREMWTRSARVRTDSRPSRLNSATMRRSMLSSASLRWAGCWVIIVLVAHAQRTGCGASSVGGMRAWGQGEARTEGQRRRAREERTRDAPRLVGHFEAREPATPPRVELGARARPARGIRLQPAAERSVASHDRIGRAGIERSPQALLELERHREQRRRDPALGIGVEGAVGALRSGAATATAAPDKRVAGVHRANGGLRRRLIAESDGVDVVERADQAVKRPLAEAAVPGHAERHAGIGELEEDRRAPAQEKHPLRGVPAERIVVVEGRHQYQLYRSECAHAPHEEP